MRILFIAPEAAGINWPQEIELISRWHQVTPLLGVVTQSRLLQATVAGKLRRDDVTARVSRRKNGRQRSVFRLL